MREREEFVIYFDIIKDTVLCRGKKLENLWKFFRSFPKKKKGVDLIPF